MFALVIELIESAGLSERQHQQTRESLAPFPESFNYNTFNNVRRIETDCRTNYS